MRQHSTEWDHEKNSVFKDFFIINHEKIKATVQKIHNKINFQEAPLYLPEIIVYYPDLILKGEDDLKSEKFEFDVHTKKVDGKHRIIFPKGLDMRPFIRFEIAKEMANYFLPSHPSLVKSEDKFNSHLSDVESNIFASELLTPTNLIKKEIKKLDPTQDIVLQLANIFWVSKNLMNKRLKFILSQM